MNRRSGEKQEREQCTWSTTSKFKQPDYWKSMVEYRGVSCGTYAETSCLIALSKWRMAARPQLALDSTPERLRMAYQKNSLSNTPPYLEGSIKTRERLEAVMTRNFRLLRVRYRKRNWWHPVWPLCRSGPGLDLLHAVSTIGCLLDIDLLTTDLAKVVAVFAVHPVIHVQHFLRMQLLFLCALSRRKGTKMPK